MLQVSIDKILPVTEARANIAKLVDQVEHGDIYVLTRGGKPAAVMVPVEKAEQIMATKSTKTNLPKKFEKPANEVVEKKPEQDDLVVKPQVDTTVVEKEETPTDVASGIDLNKVNEELAKYEN